MTFTNVATCSAEVVQLLRNSGLNAVDTQRVVRAALDEDLRYGPDATTNATVPANAMGIIEISARQPGRLAGIPVALAVFDLVLGSRYTLLRSAADGSDIAAGEDALILLGDIRGLLMAERTALNLLCHLSGIATATAAWVDAVGGTTTRIRDSRRTVPGLRLLQKYAVRRGGGVNHRLGLGDAVLITGYHAAAAGSVAAAMAAVRAAVPSLSCAVEVDDLDALNEALTAGADEVRLKDFTPGQCLGAVQLRDHAGAVTRLEATGNVTLERAREYAETGVDYLTVGALTHSSRSLDLVVNLGPPVASHDSPRLPSSPARGLGTQGTEPGRHNRHGVLTRAIDALTMSIRPGW